MINVVSKLFSLNRLKHFISGRIFAGKSFGLSDLLMYVKIFDDGIIIQTDGSFLATFWYRGFDLETSTEDELNILTNQLSRALNLLGSGWLFHIDMIRYCTMEYINQSDCAFPDATTLLIDEERRKLYNSEGLHYENSYVISFTYRPSINLTNKVGTLFRRNNNEEKIDYLYYLDKFRSRLQEVTDLLNYQLNLVKMTNQELLSYLNYNITGEIVRLQLPKQHQAFLKHFLATKDLTGGESPRIGDKYIRAVTVMGFPSESYPAILDRLNYVDFEYRWNTRFIMINQYESTKIIDRLANLWYQKRIGAIDTIKMSLAIDSNVKINQHSESYYHDAEQAKFLNESGELKFGFYTSTVIILDEDEHKVEQNARQIQSVFRNLGFQSQIERHHSLEAYLGSLPGYSFANVRKWLIHSLNVADLIPSTSIWSGLKYNPCSFYTDNNPPLFYARTTGGTPLRLSLHVEDNGHTLILGPTGSGKSTLLNFLIAQHFRYKNARVFVFDKDRSCLPLCYSCNGTFYDIGNEDNSIYFQPLANLDTDFDFDFALNWLEEICILSGMKDKFNDTHRMAISKALKLMKEETPLNRRTISYFRYLVQDYDQAIANVLAGFSSEAKFLNENISHQANSGLINKIFDAAYDPLNFGISLFNAFEMGKLMSYGDRVIIPVLRYLVHVISKQFDSGEPTLVIFDESFLFFKHALFRERIIEWIKTVRKFNVAIIFATQEIADLFQYTELISVLHSNCATKIFLPNKKAAIAEVSLHYKRMGLNARQIDLIAHAVRGEYFYLSELGSRKFSLDLVKSSASYNFVGRTSNADIKLAKEIKDKYNELFAYYWLKHFGLNDIANDWLDYHNQLQLTFNEKPKHEKT